jgi:hypothetical protein
MLISNYLTIWPSLINNKKFQMAGNSLMKTLLKELKINLFTNGLMVWILFILKAATLQQMMK